MRRSADDWFIVDHPANCCPSGPGFPTTPVCCVPHATQQGERLQSASTPEVPFCDAARVATAVVLARRSAVGWRREIADSECAGIGCHSQSLRSEEHTSELQSLRHL